MTSSKTPKNPPAAMEEMAEWNLVAGPVPNAETPEVEELLTADLRAIFERMAEASATERPAKPVVKLPSKKSA